MLKFKNGKKVRSKKQWERKRRPEILQLFKDEVYGNIPNVPTPKLSFQIVEQGRAYNDKALRKQVEMTIQKGGENLVVNLLIYLPLGIEKPPLFLGYNYYGNQSITDDPEVLLPKSWVRTNEQFQINDHKATEASRNQRGYRWGIEMMLENGFGLAVMYYGDVDPDRKGYFSDGIHPFFYQEGQTKPAQDEWGAIGAWAWGASRALDYIKQDELTQNSKVIMFGHSRLGKTALWAAAQDERFDMVISNNSGCGGAALSKRKFGETIKIINTNFPHWFADNFEKYNDSEEDLVFDQHMLIALMAPRPVYIASAEEDAWADPKGEFLSGFAAGEVYSLYQKPILKKAKMPKVNAPLHDAIVGYHIRTGKHDVTDYDWKQYIAFANKWLK
ncbi:MAG: acetylxylan esterase [Bacteroidota bacterium]